ncbi:MFS transporter [Streptosporangiaceae bacterium NEAU-GS5]|nr:MFS transporter [Streptosporangiaceae bacterium NEAU-GS5]
MTYVVRVRRGLGVLWATEVVSVVGSSFTLVAMPLLILAATGSVAQMGLLTGVGTAGSLVTGLVGGMIVDRMDRRWLMVGCNVARFALLGLVPLLGPKLWLLYAVTALSAGFGMLFQIAYVAVVAGLVGKADMTRANGRMEATYALASVLGPVLAGLVAGRFGPSAAIAVDSISFGVAGLALCVLRIPRTERAPSSGALADFLEGARFLWAQPVLRTMTFLLTPVIFLSLGLTDILIFHVRHDLQQGGQVVGYVLTAAAAGTIAGGALVGPLRARLGFSRAWIGSQVLIAVLIMALGLTQNAILAGIVAAGFSFGITVGGICSMSLRQQITPAHLLGRVTSAFWTIHFSLGPVGAAVVTGLAGNLGIRTTCLLVGAAYLAIPVIACFTPVARIPRGQEPHIDDATEERQDISRPS